MTDLDKINVVIVFNGSEKDVLPTEIYYSQDLCAEANVDLSVNHDT